MSQDNPSRVDTDGSKPTVQSAGAFDIRSIIGGLLGLYGILLTSLGLFFTSAGDKSKADGVNLNLYVGIGLLIFGALMIAWVVLRPLRVPVEQDAKI